MSKLKICREGKGVRLSFDDPSPSRSYYLSSIIALNGRMGFDEVEICASGGTLFQKEALDFTNTAHDFIDGIAYLGQHADEIGPAIVADLEKTWNDYIVALQAGDSYEAGKLFGEFYYQVGTVLFAAVGTAKSLMSGLKSVAPKFAATVEAAGAARGAKVGNEAAGVASRAIRLVDNFYEAEGSPFKFSKFYYEKLTDRVASPFIVAEEVLKTSTSVSKDTIKIGFYRYTNGVMEMVYNPGTREVWHLQHLKIQR